MRSAPTLKIWMTPLSSVAILEKLALLKIAFCRAPALSSASLRWTSVTTSSLPAAAPRMTESWCFADMSQPPSSLLTGISLGESRAVPPQHSPLQTLDYIANRRTGGNPSRDVLSLRQGECSQRAPTGCRSNPAVLRQHKVNGHMALAEDPPNLMQRLSRLPTAPHITPLHRGKLHSSPLRHKHHLSEKRFISDGVASTG